MAAFGAEHVLETPYVAAASGNVVSRTTVSKTTINVTTRA